MNKDWGVFLYFGQKKKENMEREKKGLLNMGVHDNSIFFHAMTQHHTNLIRVPLSNNGCVLCFIFFTRMYGYVAVVVVKLLWILNIFLLLEKKTIIKQ